MIQDYFSCLALMAHISIKMITYAKVTQAVLRMNHLTDLHQSASLSIEPLSVTEKEMAVTFCIFYYLWDVPIC